MYVTYIVILDQTYRIILSVTFKLSSTETFISKTSISLLLVRIETNSILTSNDNGRLQTLFRESVKFSNYGKVL